MLRNAGATKQVDAYCYDGDREKLRMRIQRKMDIPLAKAFSKFFGYQKISPRAGTVLAEAWLTELDGDLLKVCTVLGRCLEVLLPSQSSNFSDPSFHKGFNLAAEVIGKIGPIFRSIEIKQRRTGSAHKGVIQAFAALCRGDVIPRASKLVTARVQTLAGKPVNANDKTFLVQANYGTYAHFIVMFATLVRADDTLRLNGRAIFADNIFDAIIHASEGVLDDTLLYCALNNDSDDAPEKKLELDTVLRTLQRDLLTPLSISQLEQLLLHAFLRFSPKSNDEDRLVVAQHALAVHLIETTLKKTYDITTFLKSLGVWLSDVPVILFQIGRLHDMLHG